MCPGWVEPLPAQSREPSCRVNRLSHDVETITGRPATGVREFVLDHPDLFRERRPRPSLATAARAGAFGSSIVSMNRSPTTRSGEPRRWIAACCLSLLGACGGIEPKAPLQSASAAPAIASPAIAPSAIPTASAVPVSPEPASSSTTGDVTCERDADCAITTRAACCDCCESAPRATSRAWLDWRDHTMCAPTKCEPCGSATCRSVEPAATFRTACEGGQCALFRVTK